MTICPVRMEKDDARLIYQWRREVEPHAVLHKPYPTFESFFDHFRSDYFQVGELPPFFLVHEGKKVAAIRFRPYQYADSRSFVRTYEISLLVAPEEQKKGFGLTALKEAATMAREQGVHELVALIHPENLPSAKVFRKAGYSSVESRLVVVDTLEGHHEYELNVYSCRLATRPALPHVFLVAEIGSNWKVGTREQNREMARRLVESAAVAGVDAVKFQTFRAESVYAPAAGQSGYLAELGIQRDIHDIFRELEMDYEDLAFLAQLAQDSGLAFMSTPFSVEDFTAVDPYVAFHKVASYETCHIQLLEKMAHSKKPLFVSTGASFIQEVAFAVNTLRSFGCEDITLLQCTAAYPADPSFMNLRAMLTLHAAFGLPVGLSDHSLDAVTAPILAVAYGASVIEKHITMDRTLPGPDQQFAIEPRELALFVEKVRMAEKMVGSGWKGVLAQEEELFRFAKRAIQATCPIQKGEACRLGKNMAILRPGNNVKGAHPSQLPALEGKRANRALEAGEGIGIGDVV